MNQNKRTRYNVIIATLLPMLVSCMSIVSESPEGVRYRHSIGYVKTELPETNKSNPESSMLNTKTFGFSVDPQGLTLGVNKRSQFSAIGGREFLYIVIKKDGDNNLNHDNIIQIPVTNYIFSSNLQ